MNNSVKKEERSYVFRHKLLSTMFVVFAACILFRIGVLIYYRHYPQPQPCKELICEVTGAKSPLGEFKSTIGLSKSVEQLYNGCEDAYENTNFMDKKQTTVSRRDKETYPGYTAAGIMAVVQNMTFYVDESRKCRDYLQFSDGRDYPGDEFPKTCGTLDLANGINETIGPMSFVSNGNKIQVSYSLFSNKEGPTDIPDRSLNIKFTTFYKCPDSGMLNEIGDENSMRSCSDQNMNSCIPSEYFCDGVINCADFGDGAGWDEQNCDEAELMVKNLNTITDDSSELSLSDGVVVAPNPDARSVREKVNWFIILVVLPMCILVLITLSILSLYFKHQEVSRINNMDLRKLRAFLKRTGLTVDDLKNVKLSRQLDPAFIDNRLKNPVETVKITNAGQIICVDPNDPKNDHSLPTYDSLPTFSVIHR